MEENEADGDPAIQCPQTQENCTLNECCWGETAGLSEDDRK